ncbi:lipopolysaccharide assembly protein LapB [Thermococcus sp. Bubb.Bath]|uniref:tetratricopeptide repeat protein n=1 Tax=Thermococcus sp. Bubb.Bath TaxID=1638242 RepID=UPI00143A6D75|nr:tetratricopeptide repeat protein [Thermococcus sp. Bubb.Bath]NJF25868.1 tetratricopeptide repeat protein [Thermococcus sp. Bubb.Bath]
MSEVKADWENALAEKNCERLLELFDDYMDSIDDEEELKAELKRLKEVVVECEDPYELAGEIGHLYAHLDEPDEGIELYKRLVEMKKDDPEEYATALYYLADAYEGYGMADKAVETYEKLLEHEENVLKNEKEIGLTLANLAVNYDELGETEKAIELMTRAREIFERIKDEKNGLISLLDLAHFKYELGEYDEAETLIKEVLRNPRDDEIEINARLIEAEIWAGRNDYGKAFKALRDALVKAIDVNDEIFELVFETLTDFIEGLFNEGSYETVAKNMEAFAELFEDDTAHFFRAIAELAKWKAGDEEAKKRFDELYSKVENEDLKAILDEWKRPKLTLGLGL